MSTSTSRLEISNSVTAKQAQQFLAVDLGGTKTDVAVYLSGDESLTPVDKKRYLSAQAAGIEEIISDFLESRGLRCETICLAVAGVVQGDSAQVTNLPWKISKEGLAGLGFKTVSIINDMTAVASCLPLLGEKDLFCLQKGRGLRGPVSAVLAPGTGLGEGFLIRSDDYCFPRGTEGGHADFAPVDGEQRELLEWLAAGPAKTVSYESVCAGPAISTLYDFYRGRGEVPNHELYSRLSELEDRTPAIVEAAAAGSCPVCVKSLNLFFRILGREGANLVLKLYATGGLFLGGGILPRLVDSVSFVPILKAFHFPGPMAALLAATPIHIILRQDAALLGAAGLGKRLFS